METLDERELIHEGYQPAVDGMLLTFINNVKQKELKQYLNTSKKVKKILPLLVNKSIYSHGKEEKITCTVFHYCAGVEYQAKRSTNLYGMHLPLNKAASRNGN